MRRVTAILFGLAALLLPVGVVLSHRNVPVVLVLIALCGLPALRHFRPQPWVTAVFALIVWGIVTTLWSPYGNAASWVAYLVLLGLFGTAAMQAGEERAAKWLAIGTGASLLLLTIESLTGGILRDIIPPEGRPDKDDVATARGITVIICMAPGLLLYLFQSAALKNEYRLKIVLGLLIPLGICAASFDISANMMAFLAALGAAGLVCLIPKWGLKLVLAAAILPFLLMPILVAALPPIEELSQLEAGPQTWRMRLIIWKAIWGGMSDGWAHFLFGHGIEGARIYGETLGQMSLGGQQFAIDLVPTHPHNVYLQIWFDLGFVGAVFASVASIMAGRALLSASLPVPVRAASAALIASVAIFALTDASLWTLWRVAGPLLGAWLILVASRSMRQGGAQ
ncbi:O-antigen ligase family protein [Parvularcula marina]|uniref:O-antigen ligase family protein n=1 Tax=Parvularcula marina TaxID=2292771 RepID=UPI003518ADE5